MKFSPEEIEIMKALYPDKYFRTFRWLPSDKGYISDKLVEKKIFKRNIQGRYYIYYLSNEGLTVAFSYIVGNENLTER